MPPAGRRAGPRGARCEAIPPGHAECRAECRENPAARPSNTRCPIPAECLRCRTRGDISLAESAVTVRLGQRGFFYTVFRRDEKGRTLAIQQFPKSGVQKMSEPLRLAARAAAVLCFAALWSSSAFGTTKTWGNYEGGGNWNNPLNWSPAGVPTSADDVVISSSGGNCNIGVNAFASSVTVQKGGVLWVLAGNLLTVSGAIDVNSGGVLNTNSSNIQSNGVLTLNGTLHHFGGTILGSGSLSIGSGGVLEFWGTDNSSVLTLPTTNAGTITFLNTVVPPKNYTFNAGTLTNNGTIDIQTDEPINDGGIAGTLTNDGTLKKSVGSGTCDFNLTVNNGATGTVKSQSGTLALVAGGSNR